MISGTVLRYELDSLRTAALRFASNRTGTAERPVAKPAAMAWRFRAGRGLAGGTAE